MNGRKETIQSITEDFKGLILKRQKDLENKTKTINEYSKIIQATKEEYQNLYNKNIKKILDKYQNYYKVQQQQQVQKQKLMQKQPQKILHYQNNKKKRKQKQQILNDINSLEDIDLSKPIKSKRKI